MAEDLSQEDYDQMAAIAKTLDGGGSLDLETGELSNQTNNTDRMLTSLNEKRRQELKNTPTQVIEGVAVQFFDNRNRSCGASPNKNATTALLKLQGDTISLTIAQSGLVIRATGSGSEAVTFNRLSKQEQAIVKKLKK